MQRGIVYKQRYAPVKEAKTKIFNVRHLIYIATRPGTVYNQNSRFGLWGKLNQPNNQTEPSVTGTVEDLQTAVDRVRAISNENKTIYRAVFSLDDKTAKKEGYYNRGSWQKLTMEHVSAIAKEKNMDIDDKNFEWVASYHNEKGHPHCHIMFWDNSDKVRNEYISPRKFKIIAENIRVEFNKEIFTDEVANLIEESDIAKKEIFLPMYGNLGEMKKLLLFDTNDLKPNVLAKNLLCGAMIELNEVENFNIKLSTDYLNDVADKLNDVIASLPKTGSVDYMYLQPHVKDLVDSLSNSILSNNDFNKLKSQYLRLSEEISRKYGNGDKSIEFNVDKTQKKLYNSLGNSVIKFIKENNLLVAENHRINEVLEENKSGFLKNSFEFLETSKDYEKLFENFSTHRLPMKKAMNEELWKMLNSTVKGAIGSPDAKQNLNVVLSILDKITEDKTITEEQTKNIMEYKKKFKSKDTEITANDINRFFAFAEKNNLSKQLSNQLLEKLKIEKGWYDFRDKVSAITTLDELVPIESSVRGKLTTSLADIIKNDIELSVKINSVVDKLPVFTHRYKAFYETDEMKALVDEAVKHIINVDSISSLGFDFIDCEMQKNILSTGADVDEKDVQDILKKNAFFAFYKEINKSVIDECVLRKGWAEIRQQELSIRLMSNLFAGFSQSVGQLNNGLKANPSALISRDKSKEQMKELALKLESASMNWDEER